MDKIIITYNDCIGEYPDGYQEYFRCPECFKNGVNIGLNLDSKICPQCKKEIEFRLN
jgi:hypothetical protein